MVFSDGRKFVRRSVHLIEINISIARPNERFKRRHCSSRHRIVSHVSRGFSGELPPKWTNSGGHPDVIGCFRCDGRLIREAVEIDFRVGKRLAVEIPKGPRGHPATFYDRHKFPFILDENKFEKENRFPWEM